MIINNSKNKKPSIPPIPSNIQTSNSLMIALEPRILFDAAALLTATDEFQDQDAAQLAQSTELVAEMIDSANQIPAENELLQAAIELAISPDYKGPSFTDSSQDLDYDLNIELRTTIEATQNIPETDDSSQPVIELTAPPERNKELIFIDAGIENYQTLIDGIQNPDVNTKLEIIIIDSNQNGIEQITSVLADQNQNSITAIHILSEASEANLQLGNIQFDRSDLYASDTKTLVSQWQTAFAPDADILLYGCNVAAGETGIAFVEHLSELTQADVAASNDVTGNAEQGGDWDLEISTGLIET
ncbi:MAG: DUF4347 domain-containing protein, partial [Thiomargarita sp.]|nr:DUF4347 domain-containing protein [Thiomargarita sp.]